MQYLLLIYQNEANDAKRSEAEASARSAEYGVFTQSIIQSGNFKAGDRLQPTSTATTVRVRDGKTLTTDGPFAETHEQLGGYYLIEAKDLDTALGLAARMARWGAGAPWKRLHPRACPPRTGANPTTSLTKRSAACRFFTVAEVTCACTVGLGGGCCV